MNTKMSKRQRDLKAKLMAAIAMLLVSSIMMVSTTYAWFTLSTAPEVTGITTSVGANGNLEMALLPKENPFDTAKIDFGITSAVGDGEATKTALQKNVTWGNLVDLEDAAYGLSNITLYPSALNISSDKILTANPLKYPQYGADGRVTALSAGTSTSVYENGFMPNDYYGVRAVGSASGMTPRQQTYRIAKSNAAAAATTATSSASSLLKRNGNSLGSIAIKYGANKNEATFTYADVLALETMATGMKAVFAKIDEAYLQYMLAYAASSATTDDIGENGQPVAGSGDAKYLVMKGLIDGSNNSLNAFMQALANAEQNPQTVLGSLMTGISKLGYSYTVTEGETTRTEAVDGSKGKITQAIAKINELKALETTPDSPSYSYKWEQIKPILTLLANPDNMEVNDIPTAQLMDRIDELMESYSSGVNIKIKTGGGVFADVADHAGNYVATDIVVDITDMGMPIKSLTTNMSAEGQAPSYLSAVGGAIPAAPAGGEGQVAISDMYGYIIDLAFKTNAAGSKLVLQQTPTDRIYTGNTTNGGAEVDGMSTMGHGANMTFKSTNSSFTTENVKALMDNIVIVFFNAVDGQIVHYAKLDTSDEGVTESSTGDITAKIMLVEAPTASDVTNYIHTTNATDSGDGFNWTTYWKDSAKTETKLYRVRTVAAVVDNPETDEDESAEAYEVWQKATYETNTTGEGEAAVTTTTFKEWVAVDPTDAVANAVANAADEAALQTALQAAGAQGVTTKAGYYAPSSNQEIMDLPQNVAVQLSALVYLDGTTITNADVSATGTQSLTGSMNLQFSSTADLTPMNYTPLMNTTAANTNGGTATEYTVAMATDSKAGVTLKDATAKAVDNTAFVFELSTTEGVAKVEYKVGTSETYKEISATDGKYTIPAAEVKGNITIKVS